ncbi:NADP oxidoreductase, partial [Streptomyces sp. SID2563]|uniref:NADPH-dependent F420 reductase n=1 Tax=Streptomyces sp. SID2563 TaxID=2690255 RepID=UPI00136C60B1
RRLAARLGGGARAAGLREAAAFGDVVLAALPFGAGAEVIRDLGPELRGKALIDCSNPVGPGFRLLTRGGVSAAERLADAAPGAHVVKAFNLCHEDVWRMRPPVFDGRPLAVPVCGDDGPSLACVHRLVRDAGCEPVPGGGLERAGLLEATAALFIGLWVGEGADAQAIAPPLAYAAG